jgi:hypothetical protein
VGRPYGDRGPEAQRRGFFFRRPPASGEERVDAPPPHFADAQEKQQLWEELRDHDASLNRLLNEALRIHSGPAWRVFQV